MKSEARFITRHEARWQALEAMNKRLLKRGIKQLNPQEVREFARLFRLASHHLAYAKTHFPQGQILHYLNRLVGVSHNFFYVREGNAFMDGMKYFTQAFPKTVRETWRYSGLAMGLFFLGLFFAAFYGHIWPPILGDNPQAVVDSLGPPDTWDGAYMSAFFTVNNTTVAINALVWGILGGVGTLYIMIYNGIVVGALVGFLHQSGADMWMAYSLLLPHGVIELFAIFLSGGAGLMIAKGLLIPGKYSRKHALILQARKAAALVPGIVFLLIVAALIEGFFTPLGAVSAEMKLIFASFTALACISWVLYGG
jgi:uncharacterized membrane protein SpoIIM required for sporulation